MTTIAQTSQQATRESFVNKYPLTTFFVLAIGLTWVFMITDALGSHNLIPFRLSTPLLVVMGYMPTLAAVIVTALTRGKQGVKALLSKLLIARVGLQWYVFAIFGFAVLSVLSILIYITSSVVVLHCQSSPKILPIFPAR